MMVETQLARRGIREPWLLEAFRVVPRERFVSKELSEFAYEDSPLPIEEGQTISQPFIVALTVQALAVTETDRVLEIGTGSGYAAAILSRVAKEVYSVERLPALAETARARLEALAYDNVHILCGDGTLGWPQHEPYDAIAVAAGGPSVPPALLSQLAPGGRLVMPVGKDADSQVLIRVTRGLDGRDRTEELTSVRFVPLIGAQGWPSAERPLARPIPGDDRSLSRLIRETAEPLEDLGPLLERIGRAKLVLIGEATHGTSEFYRLRARLSRELIARHGFNFVAIEGDWPDAMRVNHYVLNEPRTSSVKFEPFARFPTWMWRNQETSEFIEWLRAHDREEARAANKTSFYGLDLYSLFTSIAHVIEYLERVDPDAARVARHRYGALTPWQKDPAAYGEAVLVGRYGSSEHVVVKALEDLLARRLDYARKDGERFFDAAQNAKLVANAEQYYRTMYYGSAASWNLRDSHMFDTLEALLDFHGGGSRGIVWAHNSHVGDARATEMASRGELNLGELCKTKYGSQVFVLGFGTDHGVVAAASNWDEPMQRMRIRPAHPRSYESLCHDAGVPAFRLHVREPRRKELREALLNPRLQRAIGVVYRPQTELASHYFEASLPRQFDEYVWFDETSPVVPLQVARPLSGDLPETYPFGL